MPTDAKCGLAVGFGVVLTVGVLFFRGEPPAQAPGTAKAPAAAVHPPQPPAVSPEADTP